MSRHGKHACSQPVLTPTRWEESLVDALVDSCVETTQSVMKTSGAPMSKFEWVDIRAKFEARTGLVFDKKALKNKWDQLRKEWSLWKRLTQNTTGLGWDTVAGYVSMSDEWWELKIKENKEYAKFRKHGFRYREQLEFCFDGGVATGKFCVPPKVGEIPPSTNRGDPPLHEANWFGDDVYTPQRVRVETERTDVEDVSSTASSPSKDAWTTPISKLGFIAPLSGNISSPLMPPSNEKQASGPRKRKSGERTTTAENPTMNRIASALEVHNELVATRLRCKTDSAPGSSPVSAAFSTHYANAPPTETRDVAVVALNELMQAGELTTDQYYFGLDLVSEPHFRGVFRDMLPHFRVGYIIKKFEGAGQK